jgi:hypothetical protein
MRTRLLPENGSPEEDLRAQRGLWSLKMTKNRPKFKDGRSIDFHTVCKVFAPANPQTS